MPVTNKNDKDRLANLLAMSVAPPRCRSLLPTGSGADDPVVGADRTRVQALEKGSGPAAEKLIDADFGWIDSEGIMWAREDAFRAGHKSHVAAQTM